MQKKAVSVLGISEGR